MSDEHQPLWQVDDCEGHVEFDCTKWPTVQLSFRTDEDAPEHVINLTVEQAADLTRTLNRAVGRAVINFLAWRPRPLGRGGNACPSLTFTFYDDIM